MHENAGRTRLEMALLRKVMNNCQIGNVTLQHETQSDCISLSPPLVVSLLFFPSPSRRAC